MQSDKKIILIAGGTGFIGKNMAALLAKTSEVRILSRNRSNCHGQTFYWNPELGEIDPSACKGVTHIINLCGAGIADKRWSNKRKKELYDSRILPAKFLFSQLANFDALEHYISASGVNCFDWENTTKIYREEDAFASDFLSKLVAAWEQSADIFAEHCKVSKIRISFVVSEQGGGLQKMEAPIKKGFGSVLGSGKQHLPWIHLDDLSRLFAFVIDHQLEGVYHALAGNSTNKEFTAVLAKKNHKKLVFPAVPAFVLKLILGELSTLVLEGVQVSNQKICTAGFQFKFQRLEDCFQMS